MLVIALLLSMAEIEIEAAIIPECPEIQLEGSVAVLPKGTFAVTAGTNYTVSGPKRLQLSKGKTLIEAEGCQASEFEIQETITATEVMPRKKSLLLFSFLAGAVGLVLLLIWRR